MKAFRIAAIAAVAVVYATGLLAQGDPVIRTGGGCCSVAVTSFIFSVETPTGNSPALSTVPNSTDCVLTQRGTATSVPGCGFKNKITLPGGKGVTISRLVFIVEDAEYATPPLLCGTDTFLGGAGPFAACTVQSVPYGNFSIVTFSNGSIPPGGEFSMGMRGFNSDAKFAGIALPSHNSGTAEIYTFPDLSGANSAPQLALNDAPRFVGSQSLPIRALPVFERSDSRFVAAWIRSNLISDCMPGPSRIIFEPCPTFSWRIT